MRSSSGSRKVLGGLLAAVALTAAARGSDEDPSSTAQRAGGTLVFLGSTEGVRIDPVDSLGSEGFAVFDMLVYEASGTGEINYQLAESLESDDGVVWDLQLRAGLTFSDGTPLDAEAVKFNWERIGNPANNSPAAASVDAIASMEVVDAVTLRVTLLEANGQFPRDVATNLPFIGSPTAIEELGDQFGFSPIGAGPYLLDSMTEGSETVFVRNPDYWNDGLPYLDKLVLRGVADPDQRYNSLVAGEAQMMGVEAAYGLLARADADGLEVSQVALSGGVGLQLNLAAAPFDDPVARQALAYGIDREGLIDTVFSGAVPAFTNLFAAESPFFDESAEWPGYEPDRAQQLIDEYSTSHAGPLQINFFLPSFFSDYGEYLQTQLSEFDNLEVSVELVDFGVFFDRVATGDFQAAIDAPGFVDPMPVLTDAYRTDGGRNYGGYSNPDVDAALIVARESLDADERREAYATIQQHLIADVPHVWFTPFLYHQLHTAEVQDIEYAGAEGLTLFDRIWLDE